ncbi:hypothetical protein V2J09_015096 [Rumex salicifolius]
MCTGRIIKASLLWVPIQSNPAPLNWWSTVPPHATPHSWLLVAGGPSQSAALRGGNSGWSGVCIW